MGPKFWFWGAIRIENEKVCYTRGATVCSAIYRNPDGKRDNNNEYLMLNLVNGQEFFFSAYDERPPALIDE